MRLNYRWHYKIFMKDCICVCVVLQLTVVYCSIYLIHL